MFLCLFHMSAGRRKRISAVDFRDHEEHTHTHTHTRGAAACGFTHTMRHQPSHHGTASVLPLHLPTVSHCVCMCVFFFCWFRICRPRRLCVFHGQRVATAARAPTPLLHRATTASPLAGPPALVSFATFTPLQRFRWLTDALGSVLLFASFASFAFFERVCARAYSLVPLQLLFSTKRRTG